jgi:hypothetical protein
MRPVLAAKLIRENCMRTTKRALFVLTAVLLIVGTLPAVAQEPGIVEGELLRVDANAKTLMIRTADATPMQFIYTDDTKVTGADDSISGLATMTGAAVIVSYMTKQQDHIATNIEVKKTTRIAALSDSATDPAIEREDYLVDRAVADALAGSIETTIDFDVG